MLEVKEDVANKYKVILEQSMVTAAETVLSEVPAKADANVGSSWADK